MQINLISDTVTKPTKGMLKAMMDAEVGDDVFKSDPTVNKLQHKIAEMFGMEDALFFPSGTMANQTAIKIHTHHGDKMFCDKYAHVYNYEGGGAAANSGVTSHLIDGKRGTFTAKQLEEAVFGGMSSGGSTHVACEIAKTLEEGIIVCIICDRGDRYLSTGVFKA